MPDPSDVQDRGSGPFFAEFPEPRRGKVIRRHGYIEITPGVELEEKRSDRHFDCDHDLHVLLFSNALRATQAVSRLRYQEVLHHRTDLAQKKRQADDLDEHRYSRRRSPVAFKPGYGDSIDYGFAIGHCIP